MIIYTNENTIQNLIGLLIGAIWKYIFSCVSHFQEIMLQQIMSHIGSVKKDMVILEKSEFSTLRNENEVKIYFLHTQ